MARQRPLGALLSALALLLLAAMPFASSAAPDVTIHASGATLPASILATGLPNTPSWISSFQTLTNNRVTINFDGSGSFAGDDSIIADQIDFAVSEAPLTDAQMAGQNPILHIPITLAALEFSYNIPADQISGPLNLTADMVALMYTGQITNWNDPVILQANPLLSYSGPITLVVRSGGSGSSYVVTHYLATSSGEWPYGADPASVTWPSHAIFVANSSASAAAVQATVGAIGYSRWGLAAQYSLPSANVKNPAGYWTKPTQESVLAACLDLSPDFGGEGLPAPGDSWERVSLVSQPGHSTYPLVTFSYALVHQNLFDKGERGAAVVNFLQYVNLELTQAVAPSFSFVPLPLFVRQANSKTMATIALAFGYSHYEYYDPYMPRGGDRTAGILSLVLSLLMILGLAGLIIKEIHYRYGQDTAKGIY